jgi:hypothetical protein
VSLAIVLDAGPLGLLTQRKGVPEADSCKRWLASQLSEGARVLVPEIADYEVRRELLRANKAAGLARLDAFNGAQVNPLPPPHDASFPLGCHPLGRSPQAGHPDC